MTAKPNGTSEPRGHSHADGHSHAEVDGLMEAIKGNKGAQVTLLGLLVNIGLTLVKGVAGWALNSAVLLADAGHSLSDLMGDLVTLFFYTLSRRAPSKAYPYGYGKFESLGTSTVALFLLLGAWAIGWHSYSQLDEAIPWLHDYIPILSSIASASSESAHHASSSEDALDPNAAWIAVLSILVKEGMYRLSAAVAKAENSPVLLANALHHRSDMYSSFVSLVAILGNWWMPSLPLDPIGGLLVTLLILHQASELLHGSLFELTDHSVPEETLEPFHELVSTTLSSPDAILPAIPKLTEIRAIRRGAHVYVDVSIDLVGDSEKFSLAQAVRIEDMLLRNMRASSKSVKDVRVRWAPVSL